MPQLYLLSYFDLFSPYLARVPPGSFLGSLVSHSQQSQVQGNQVTPLVQPGYVTNIFVGLPRPILSYFWPEFFPPGATVIKLFRSVIYGYLYYARVFLGQDRESLSMKNTLAYYENL